MKKSTMLALALTLDSWVSQGLTGGTVLQGARVIYDVGEKEVTLPVANHGEGLPYLLQPWVDSAQGAVRGPFIITSPFFRLDANGSSSLRIIKSSEGVANDEESLFSINVHTILAKSQAIDTNNNILTLVLKARVKPFYHPTNLVDKPYDAYKSLEHKYSNNELDIYNPSAYHVAFAGPALGKTDLTNKIDYIAPDEYKRLAVPVTMGKTARWTATNEHGSTTKTETQTLQ